MVWRSLIVKRLNQSHLIVFAKAPVPGQVKTRLIPSLGALAAAKLHENLVWHSVTTAVNSGVGPVHLWCAPSTEDPFFRRCAHEFGVELRVQTEGDLGRRMASALRESLKVASSALLIGTDCPSLTREDLRAASMALQKGAEAVIGPTEDGGYALIGLKRVDADLFKGITWGAENVLKETRNRLRALGWKWHELPVRWDIDRLEDVERLKRENDLHLLRGVN